jgi:stage II sporulation protein D
MAEVSVGGLDPLLARRVLELQAIAARTFAVANLGRHARDGYDLCDGTHCQLFRAIGPATARQAASAAAEATRGEVIVADGATIEAVFHADCGGHTSAAELVWGEPRTYLQPVADPACARPSATGWTWRVGRSDLQRALAGTAGLPSRIDDIEITSRDVAGRVTMIALRSARSHSTRAPGSVRSGSEDATSLKGTVFRAAMLRTFGATSLRSTLFTVTRRGDEFTFAGRGNGHGVGLCQAGARQRIAAGQSPEEVIRHYYRGARVRRVSRSAGL